jgi:hypothetical protein
MDRKVGYFSLQNNWIKPNRYNNEFYSIKFKFLDEFWFYIIYKFSGKKKLLNFS